MDSNSFSGTEGLWILSFKKMKMALICTTAVMGSLTGFSQVAINTTGNPPDPDAMLDVSSTNKGLLIPRISLSNRPSALKTGMLVYQTDNVPGFYFANGTDWVRLGDADQNYWLPAIGSDIRFPYKIALGEYTDAQGHGLNVANYFTAKGAVRGTVEISGNLFAEGFLGVMDPEPLGIPFNVTNIGVLGIKPNTGSNGAAVYGWNNQNHPNGNFAGVFISNGAGSYDNYAILSRASGGWNNYAGYYRGRVKIEGNTVDDSAPDYLSTLLEAQVMHNQANDTRAVSGISMPQPGWGIGVYGQGGYYGIYGFGDASNYSGAAMGVYGYATGSAGSRYGLYGNAFNSGGTEAFGVYGSASGAAANWAGYFDGTAYVSDDLRIGTFKQAAGYALSVKGKVACEEVLVEMEASWPDYVFSKDYSLTSLKDLEKAIEENGHLPGLPSATEVNENGFELGDMQKRVVEKLEELTLYTIQQQKLIDQLRADVELLKKENESLLDQSSK